MPINTYRIKIRKRGQITIPQPVRKQGSIQTGDIITLVQFDDFVCLVPNEPKIPALAKQFSQIMDEEGVTMADLLQGVADERS